MVQHKQADTAIDWHEGEIAGEVIVDNTADLLAKAPTSQTPIWIASNFIVRFNTF